MFGEYILNKNHIMELNFKKKISIIIFNAFFFIPPLTILGPLLPDLIISITIIFSFFILLNSDNNFFNIKFRKKFDSFILIFFLFFLFILLGSVINYIKNDILSYQNFENYFSRSLFLFRFIFYPVSIIYLAKKFDIKIQKKYLLLFLITICFVIFDTIFQYFNGTDIFGFVPIERGVLAIGRLSGPFGDELIPGSFLMRYFFISILFIFFLIKNKFYLNIIVFFFIIFCLSTVILTGERSASLLCFFGITLFFIFFKSQRFIIGIGSTIFLIISIIVLIQNPILKKRVIDDTLFQFGFSKNIEEKNPNLKKIFKNIGTSFLHSHYGAHWETAYEIWKDNKLIGIGLKQFRYKCSDKKYDNNLSKLKVIRCATHPHNTYFEVLSETGIIGIFIFLFLIIFLFKKIYKIYNYDSLIKLPLISIILLFWPIITTGSFFTNMTQIYLSFLLTIIFMIENKMFENFNKVDQ